MEAKSLLPGALCLLALVSCIRAAPVVAPSPCIIMQHPVHKEDLCEKQNEIDADALRLCHDDVADLRDRRQDLLIELYDLKGYPPEDY